MERLKRFIHSHTHAGRREQYMDKHAVARDQARGIERYELDLALEKDAKKYADTKVMQDRLFVASVVFGGYLGVRIARDGWESVRDDFIKGATRIADAGRDLADAAGRAYDAFLYRTGERVADGAGAAFRQHVAVATDDIARRAPDFGKSVADGMMASVHERLPGMTEDLQMAAQSVGETVADTIRVRIIDAMPQIIEAARISFELATLNRLFPEKRGSGK